VSIADDANAIFFNPSGLARLSRPELTSMYAKLFPNIGDNLAQGLFGYVRPVGALGTVGLGWQSLMSDLWDGNIVTLSYARDLLERVALGANFKVMRWDVAPIPNDPVTGERDPMNDHRSQMCFGVDAGLLWSPAWNITVGAFVKNLNQPNIAYDSSLGGDLPMEIHIGLGYRFPMMVVSTEFVNTDGKKRLLVGAERSLAATGLSLRLGGNWNSLLGLCREKKTEEKQSELGQGSFGLGYKLAGFRVDYSYIYYAQLADTGGAHRFSIGYKF
ncbi:MAG: type IX secretion system membrane protein PorP/SprF, partial [Candidatus Latescibacteria bacterium]|nr:type IX secretion system membrane protein PorP/SprF [Candidatus Latescibacterota bacterium]